MSLCILVTVPALGREFGGPAGKAGRLCATLRERGHDVVLAGVGASGASGTVALPSAGRFHATPLPRALRPLLAAARSVDVVHVVGYRDPVGTAAALAARRAGVPYVLEPVGMHRRRLRSARLKAAFDASAGRRVVGGAAALVATSALEAAELAADGIPPARVHVRANGVDPAASLAAPDLGALRRRHGIGARAPLVLALGRIAAKKGLQLLAAAVADLPGVHLLVAGPDDRDGTLRRLLALRERLGLDRRLVVLPGGLWDRDKAQALADADAFCLPSATENFGIAAAEAACAGLPVVVSDRCGVAEFLDPRATRVVAYGQVAALRRALEEVLADGDIARAARRAAPQVRATLHWRSLAARQEDIYRAALDVADTGAGR